MKIIWITGSMGHVGSALTKLLDCKEYEVVATDVDEVDITDEDQVRRYMNMTRPDVVINCAGYTDVELCEKNIEEAYKVNAVGVRNLAQAAESIQAKLIQISTDDVFDLMADVPYNEFDEVHPKTIYGKSKCAGERFVSQLMTRYVIIRSSWIYGTGNDFVGRVLRAVGNVSSLEVPDNRYAVPTSASELAKTIVQFIDNDHYGTYHAVCTGGKCSRYEFAVAVLEYANKSSELELIPVAATDGNRPEYSVLDNMMLRITGLNEPANWRDALRQYIQENGGQNS
jgi:dTDP-4-dehydrorhamnose reductase